MAKKKEFVSNVTGEEWYKHNSKRWSTIINQVGTIIEDELHQGKHGEKLTLKAGSKVIIDDIRGRIKPQYRVLDTSGKVWFVSALNVEVETDKSIDPNLDKYDYRGGVRHDGQELHPRYTVSKTTEEEYAEVKQKEKEKKNA